MKRTAEEIWHEACLGREGFCSIDLQDAAREAIRTGQAEERALVVAHLRAMGAWCYDEMAKHNEWSPMWLSCREQGETFEEAADRIERLEHHGDDNG